jgi:hypothetical protein
MFVKLIHLASFVFGLGLILTSAGNAADPDLVGWWRFDETSGTTAHDASGNGNDGTLQGDPTWVTGKIDGALALDGNGDYVDIGSVGISGINPRTIAGWARASTTTIPGWTTVFGFAPDGNTDGTYYDVEVDDAGNYVVHVGGWQAVVCPVDTQWHHFAANYDGGVGNWYLDGQFLDSLAGAIGTIDQMRIGARLSYSNFFPGLVDDVRIYNKALTLAEIEKIMAGPRAYDPTPADGAVFRYLWVTLGWSPGEAAVSHDVYFGSNLDNVSDGTGETFQGNQTLPYFVAGTPESPYPDTLVPDTTYYWRIDEVEADGTTIHTGNVWSFTLPPRTAYDPDPADGTEFVDPNAQLSWTAGFDAKLHTVYLGDNFDDVNSAAGGSLRGGTTYSPGTLELEKVYYWRVDEFDTVDTYEGDVWAFSTPGAVGNPSPANGAAGVQMTATLSWTPGDSATSHEVYLGTDKDAVRNATTASPEYKASRSLGSESYDPGKLAWHTAYYWRVDGINNANPSSPWPGNVWSFTTADFIVVDDFEAYDANNPIWENWLDGAGFGEQGTPGYNPGNGTGAAAGDESTASTCEEVIVHGGGQSMPYSYNNSGSTGKALYSEAELTLSYPHARNWTEQGVTELSLWFHGDPANDPERMYVAISNNTGLFAVVYHDDTNATATNTWTQWVIPLQAFADKDIGLTNVDMIAIGFGTKGNMTIPDGAGKMYFDDIRLILPDL